MSTREPAAGSTGDGGLSPTAMRSLATTPWHARACAKTWLRRTADRRTEDRPMSRGSDFYDEGVTEEYLAHRHSGVASPNTVMEHPAFVAAIGDVRGRRVLDLGCGDGSTATLFIERGAAAYHGVDGSGEMVARARRAVADARASFELADIEDFVPDRAGFDLVVSRMALHYVADLAPVLARVREGLVDGGAFVFSVVHPVITSHDHRSGAQRTDWTVDNYFSPGPRLRQWFGTTVKWHHRTVEQYVSSVLDAQFQLVALSECEPDPAVLATNPAELARRRRVPLILLLSAVRS